MAQCKRMNCADNPCYLIPEVTTAIVKSETDNRLVLSRGIDNCDTECAKMANQQQQPSVSSPHQSLTCNPLICSRYLSKDEVEAMLGLPDSPRKILFDDMGSSNNAGKEIVECSMTHEQTNDNN